jgi:hypothetical protein
MIVYVTSKKEPFHFSVSVVGVIYVAVCTLSGPHTRNKTTTNIFSLFCVMRGLTVGAGDRIKRKI